MKARRVNAGVDAGTEFWGCVEELKCDGRIDRNADEPAGARPERIAHVSEGAGTGAGSRSGRRVPNRAKPADTPGRAVAWSDATLAREDWVIRYTSGGASLRSIPIDPEAQSQIELCWVARQRLPSLAATDAVSRRVLGVARKILQRGSAPPVPPDVERRLLDIEGIDLASEARPARSGSLAIRLKSKQEPLRPRLRARRPGPLDEVMCDSAEELFFINRLVPTILGPGAAAWFTPQASLDQLVRARLSKSKSAMAARRVDFLVHTPWSGPFVVEIDGGQHGSSEQVDGDRDGSLAVAGIPTVRIPTIDLERGEGRGIDELVERFGERPEPTASRDQLVRGAIGVHRLAIGILEAVAAGFLAGDRWVIDLHDDSGVAGELIGPYLELFHALDQLWGDETLSPSVVTLQSKHGAFSWERRGAAYVSAEPVAAPPDATIRIELDSTPVAWLEASEFPTIVVRSALLPVRVRDHTVEGAERAMPAVDDEHAEQALRGVLRHIFAIEDFRPGQLDAILEILGGRDCTVLLPTGAGKSLIYQLAGLCLPGRTLVVDPIVALIEDQARSLRALGIDRVAALTAATARAQGGQLIEAVAEADAFFVFVAPERLQMAGFRQALSQLAMTTPVNIAVVDEAHCVSEWGHDFRTSYLRIGRVLRKVCSSPSGSPPPLLALTGTASRAVLRDVLLELEIEARTERSIVRPIGFDRPELELQVQRIDPELSEGALRSGLVNIAAFFGEPLTAAFQSRGDASHAGLVFCQTVNGGRGVTETSAGLAQTLGYEPPIYSGSAPKGYPAGNWDDMKRRNAASFMDDETTVLVCTKAFGMGIDKPNVHWVVHNGMPTSIEGYYQEVGRAGRDGSQSICLLVATDFDAERNRKLLSEDLDLETARKQHSAIKFQGSDDVTTAMFFHMNSFRGIEAEVASLVEVATEIAPGDDASVVELPFGKDKQNRERALHRMVVLGVVREYLVEFGSEKFVLRTTGASSRAVKEALVDHVARYQPARAGAMSAALDTTEMPTVKDAIARCGTELIRFVYETVERSRRRSLREMWLAVQEMSSADDFRARILDYLAEGDVARSIERLLDVGAFTWPGWLEEYDTIEAPDDAREWRGNTARLLSSYPDHPGLLMGRALSELLDTGGSLAEFVSNSSAALEAAGRYGLGSTGMRPLHDWLRALSERVDATERTALFSLQVEAGVDLGLRVEDGAGPGVGVLAMGSALAAALRVAEDVDLTFRERI